MTQRRLPRIETFPPDANGAGFAAAYAGLARARNVRRAMNDVIVEIVTQVIVHAQTMLDDGAYDWPATRAALERILADLEARSLGHPDLRRLRRFVWLGDEAWKVGQGETK